LGKQFYWLYQKPGIATQVHDFVTNRNNCKDIQMKELRDLKQLCLKIEALGLVPKNVNNTELKAAVSAALAFSEFANAKIDKAQENLTIEE